jgi:hypothetical protein
MTDPPRFSFQVRDHRARIRHFGSMMNPMSPVLNPVSSGNDNVFENSETIRLETAKFVIEPVAWILW